jgi:DNA polymerase III delta prime subunit
LRLGDLLLAANIATERQIARAVARQAQDGGSLGDNLVATGALTREALDEFLKQIPPEPADLAATGINPTDLLSLLLKLIYTSRLETNAEFIDAIKLPSNIVDQLIQMAVDRNLLAAMGAQGLTMRYGLSEQGRNWAAQALRNSQYAGPAPVTLDAFCNRVHLQKVTNELITYEGIQRALSTYSVPDAFIRRIGPALNSGKTMLLYGPPGNGKTSVALSFANVFNSVIYIPYAVMIEGQLMRVFDPSVHQRLHPDPGPAAVFSSLRREQGDSRWVAIRRPFVVTGGELTLEMLDLKYDATAGFYEAPLHIKALGGCFVVDDFGRQIVSPIALLNRWIVPMESRVDYLKFHNGKSFSIPFEAMVIFSTNINPEDLMDQAFLRRLPYKIEVGAPNPATYRSIFEKLCSQFGIELTDEIFDFIVRKITKEKAMDLAAYHARFIIDQVVAIARFMNEAPKLTESNIGYALDNLKVNSTSAAATAAA